MDEKVSFYYSNQVQIATSPWDITFQFQRVGPPSLSRAQLNKVMSPVVHEEVQVSMSPTHAKILLAFLIGNIHQYEQNTGKIALDPVNEKNYDDAIKLIGK